MLSRLCIAFEPQLGGVRGLFFFLLKYSLRHMKVTSLEIARQLPTAGSSHSRGSSYERYGFQNVRNVLSTTTKQSSPIMVFLSLKRVYRRVLYYPIMPWFCAALVFSGTSFPFFFALIVLSSIYLHLNVLKSERFVAGF